MQERGSPGTYVYPGDDIPRLRRQSIAIVFVLALLVVTYFMTRTEQSSDARSQAAALVKAGLIAYQEGDYRSARNDFTAAIRLDKRSSLGHYNLGLIQQVIDANTPGAEAHYREAIALNPDFSRALYNLGVLRAADGDVEEAIMFYRRAVAADDLLAAAHFNLGLLLREQDPDSEEATAAINHALALNPTLQNRIPTTTTSTTTSSTTSKKR